MGLSGNMQMCEPKALTILCVSKAFDEVVFLKNQGYQVVHFSTVQDAFKSLNTSSVDFLLLEDGFISEAMSFPVFQSLPSLVLLGKADADLIAQADLLNPSAYYLKGSGLALLEASLQAAYKQKNTLKEPKNVVLEPDTKLLCDEEIFVTILNQTAYKMGFDFLEALMQSFVAHLNVDYAFIGQPLEEDGRVVRTLVCAGKAGILENFEYELKGTPCEQVYGNETCAYPTDVARQFPEDDLLEEMQIEAYVGVPLYTRENHSLGILVCLFENTLEKEQFTKTLLQIFGSRVATELDRLNIFRELQQKNKALQRSKEKAEQSDQLKTEFIHNMSHEIRTPMNGIMAFSQLLDGASVTEEERKSYITIIRNCSQQLMRIIDDILEISRLSTHQVEAFIEEVDLSELLLELFSIFNIKAKEKGVPLYLLNGLSDEEPLVFTDRSKVHKILSNLLENALRFTDSGYVELGCQLKGASLDIYVKDTGCGISPTNHEIVFKRFSQEDKALSKKVGGLGLGLAIARENARLLGGAISLRSEKGKGTTFCLSLPYQPVKASETLTLDDPRKSEKPHQEQAAILLVEDEEISYLILEAFIKGMKLNHRVLHAKNGREAVDLCRKIPTISLVLMDLSMPIMDGFEASQRIKSMRPNIPIIAQSAYCSRKDKEQALSAGCDDFIVKPIEKNVLEEKIYKVLQ